MATEVDSMPRENMPLSQPATYAATSIESPESFSNTSRSIQINASTNSATNTPTNSSTTGGRGSFQIPSFITAPIEVVLNALGKFAASTTSLLGFSGDIATSRAKPWLEFFDLSAFKPVSEGGITAYFDRLRLNAPYFFFNYIIVGLAFTLISVITKPIAIIAVGALLWIYFQFFGSENGAEDFNFIGFSLNTSEKVGTMVFLGLIVFWVTAGGLEIFLSLLSATALVCLVHGSFRKPSHDALPESSAV